MRRGGRGGGAGVIEPYRRRFFDGGDFFELPLVELFQAHGRVRKNGALSF
jgi:hypothetical protein